MQTEETTKALLELMERLRDPESGCPWDIEQSFSTIAPYTIEEAYEVADAIERNDMTDLKDELGDLLLQVAFHSQIAREKELFTFSDVAKHVTDKMIHRHPHVFGDEKATSSKDVEDRIWEERKAVEAKKAGLESILDDVPVGFPAVLRAQKLQKRAARVGFEWPEAIDVLDKLEEEIQELREAIAKKSQDEMHEELGDMLFCVINFGRMLGIDCESSLRDTNYKFERRFKGIELDLKVKNLKIEDATLDQMEALWQDQKAKERKSTA